jgi:hypothetical protein
VIVIDNDNDTETIDDTTPDQHHPGQSGALIVSTRATKIVV